MEYGVVLDEMDSYKETRSTQSERREELFEALFPRSASAPVTLRTKLSNKPLGDFGKENIEFQLKLDRTTADSLLSRIVGVTYVNMQADKHKLLPTIDGSRRFVDSEINKIVDCQPKTICIQPVWVKSREERQYPFETDTFFVLVLKGTSASHDLEITPIAAHRRTEFVIQWFLRHEIYDVQPSILGSLIPEHNMDTIALTFIALVSENLDLSTENYLTQTKLRNHRKIIYAAAESI
ncbi:hypothetical protein QR680_011485 [Steinernema hermaphroditum]|uniref:Uncharacterized protein n=1 Tax=Steinernema hermaphroditum TaxID=289476 RepID=A0AA39I0Y4_9BILA|nr:hypothetical protein QR680_011485 [Steinernema hermaphroditum]